jgi:hypothetical protein
MNQRSKPMGYFLPKEASKEKVHQEKKEATFLLLENPISSKKTHRLPESEPERPLPLEIEAIVISHHPEKKLIIVISLLLDEKLMMSLLLDGKLMIFHLLELNQTKEMYHHQEDRL